MRVILVTIRQPLFSGARDEADRGSMPLVSPTGFLIYEVMPSRSDCHYREICRGWAIARCRARYSRQIHASSWPVPSQRRSRRVYASVRTFCARREPNDCPHIDLMRGTQDEFVFIQGGKTTLGDDLRRPVLWIDNLPRSTHSCLRSTRHSPPIPEISQRDRNRALTSLVPTLPVSSGLPIP